MYVLALHVTARSCTFYCAVKLHTAPTEIKRLMGCFLFANRGLEMSPYSDLLDPWHWTDVADIFARDACKLLGLSLESPLGVRFVR